MTLVVDEAVPGLHRSVLSALEELCPGSSFVLRDDGVVLRDRPGGCGPYCGHRAGCNLIDVLVDAPGTVTVRLTGSASGYKPEGGVGPPAGEVFWNPTQTRLRVDRCGGTRARPSVVLGHELVHALQHQRGTLNPLDPGEFEAVRGENQLRRELCELPRVEYGTKPVPGYDRAYLDVRDRRGCGCARSGRVAGRLEHDVRCFVRMALLCVLEGLEERPRPPFLPYEESGRLLEGIGEAGDVLAARVRTAVETRSTSAHAALVHRLTEESLERNPFTVCLEAVGLSATYGAILVRPADGGLSVLTNLLFREGGTMFASGPAELLEYAFPPSADFTNGLDGVAYASGIGGVDSAIGGAVQFLTVQRGGSPVMSTALYGYRYPAFDSVAPAPDGVDGPRWSAVVRIYALTRRLMVEGRPWVRAVRRAE